ncbi:EAL domain-containing protein [Stappia sp. 28M-7]|uniref:EAL domain-containing protein n=1 Tax=Stappia sp. 28M-7 TaxID=2762596 RepID=UPI00163CF9CE|nr:EAL domain-containing protein [Stappia sp. 28M-7]MBC2859724.1 PTS sugar transporter subunit IIC/EAL domain-containing protein [Stappia sp. 28M-7]
MKSFVGFAENIRFSLQEAFIALVPFVILVSAIRLIDFALIYSAASLPFLSYQTLTDIGRLLEIAMPVMLAISVSYQLSILFRIDRVTGAALALAVFFFDTYGTMAIDDAEAISLASINAVIAPLLALMMLRACARLPLPRLHHGALSYNLENALNMALPALLSFVLTAVVLGVLHDAANVIYAALAPAFFGLGSDMALALYLAGSQFIWFLGLHGTNLAYLAVPPDFGSFLVAGDMTRDMFMTSFVNLGGSGTTLGLALAILLFSRNQHMRSIALVALPFTAFNISEILVFGLPIVLNLRLLAPFVAVPVVCQMLGLVAISHIGLTVYPTEVPWVTPMFLNVYLQTGEVWAVLLQAALLGVSILLYAPFVIRYGRMRENKLGPSLLNDGADFDDHMRRQHGRTVFDQHKTLLRNSEAARNAVDFLRENRLAMHYQPEIDARTGSCIGFEALLRVWVEGRGFVGPYFLETLENAGFAHLIDRWVCRQVLQDLAHVQDAGRDLIVSINLHPDTIADRSTVDWLVQAFADMPVSFEIIERGLRSDPAIADNLRRLAEADLSVAIDDFGAGHSNFNLLADLPVSIVKFDRSLLLSAAEQRGRIVYRKLTGLCHELGYQVVAEGVETRAQADLVTSCGVDLIQGWLHAPAMPLDEALDFAARLNSATPLKSAPACWPLQPRA